MSLHKKHPWMVGLAQAALVVGYVLLFASSMQTVHSWLGDISLNPIVGMSFFLTTFVFSALFCATSMLGYPALLCFEKKYHRATQILLWSIGWLALFLLGIALIAVANVGMKA